MKKTLLVALLGLFVFTTLSAQAKHRLTGPRAKNGTYWKKKKVRYEPVASLNGMIIPGRARNVRRGSELPARTETKQRLTGPRAKNTPVQERHKAADVRRIRNLRRLFSRQ